MLERTPSTLERIFTASERAYASTLADPVPTLAARFAAREAVMKALGGGLGAFDLHDVWIDREESGRPHLRIEGKALELSRVANVTSWNVSLTHTATIAVAYVIATGPTCATQSALDGNPR